MSTSFPDLPLKSGSSTNDREVTLPLSESRIKSVDLLKGLVMVLMALDHTRDYFHWSSNYFAPEDPAFTTIPIFFTRWITHFCAPAFSFLAGISAFFLSRRKTKSELSLYLLKRGIWLVIIELTLVNFAWYFDVQFRSPTLVVIWALGISMIILSALIHLPMKYILIFSCALIFGHDLLDQYHPQGYVWAILHDGGFFEYSHGYHLSIGYPLIPWIAVMSLGYCFGRYYVDYNSRSRRNIFNMIGVSAIILFVLLRALNHYGDPYPWKYYSSAAMTMVSFMNPNKYPPSLMYLLMTLGPALLFLANSEKWKGRIVEFFSTFGRVPFFYYILHLYLIHFLALVVAELSGWGWKIMILPDWISFVPSIKGFGYGLTVVYTTWILIILLLYPLCKRFDSYKKQNRQLWWLSYW